MHFAAAFIRKVAHAVGFSLQGRVSAALLLLLCLIVGVASLQIVSEREISASLAALNEAEQEIQWAHRHNERMLKISGAAQGYSVSGNPRLRAAVESELRLLAPLASSIAVRMESEAAAGRPRPADEFKQAVREKMRMLDDAHQRITEAQQDFSVQLARLAKAASVLSDDLRARGGAEASAAATAIKRRTLALHQQGGALAHERDTARLDRIWTELGGLSDELEALDSLDTAIAGAHSELNKARRRTVGAVMQLRGAFAGWSREATALEREISQQSALVARLNTLARARTLEARTKVRRVVESSRRFGLYALAAGVLIWASVSLWLRQTVVRPLNAVIRALAELAQRREAPRIERPRLLELRRLHATIAVFERGFAQIRAMTANLSRMASLDPLTGAQNRRSLPEQFRRLAEQTDFDRQQLALIAVDLDNFKVLNDTHGHDVGDQVLTEAAKAMRAVLREGDLLGRIGGDEFVLVVRGGADGDVGALISERLERQVAECDALQGFQTPVTLSIGYTHATSTRCNFDMLLKQADMAVYEAKARGRGTFVGYSGRIAAKNDKREQAMGEIEQALAEGRVTPAYQPKIRLADGTLVGFEALARWRHPERGLLTPAAFADALADPALGARISTRVLETAASDAAALRAEGVDMLSVSVNVTQRQLLGDELIAAFNEIRGRTGLSAEFFELEVSETALNARVSARIAEMLERLSSMGVSIAFDDFGAGRASLTHLREATLDTVKIDLSLVTRLSSDPKALAIAEGVVGMARALGLQVVAEGVEDEETARLLRRMRCDVAQGFLFGRPMPIEDVASWIRDNERTLVASDAAAV